MFCAEIGDLLSRLKRFGVFEIIRGGKQHEELLPRGSRKLNRIQYRFSPSAFEFHRSLRIRIQLDALRLVRAARIIVAIRKAGKVRKSQKKENKSRNHECVARDLLNR